MARVSVSASHGIVSETPHQPAFNIADDETRGFLPPWIWGQRADLRRTGSIGPPDFAQNPGWSEHVNCQASVEVCSYRILVGPVERKEPIAAQVFKQSFNGAKLMSRRCSRIKRRDVGNAGDIATPFDWSSESNATNPLISDGTTNSPSLEVGLIPSPNWRTGRPPDITDCSPIA